jgi:hypothetical protein
VEAEAVTEIRVTAFGAGLLLTPAVWSQTLTPSEIYGACAVRDAVAGELEFP